MSGPKIVVIGAGSAGFYLSTLGDIFQEKALQNSTLCLVDVNATILGKVDALAKKVAEEFDSKIKIISSTDRTKVLHDADFIILIIAVDREATWKKDISLARKFGIWSYAENGGVGAFGHSARNIATLLPIFDDIQDLAPNAWIVNFTNPVPRIHYAVKYYTKLKCVSFCHQFWAGHYLLGRILIQDLKERGYNLENLEYKSLRNAALQEYQVTAAGLNHFTWMLDVKRKSSEEDMYPLVKKAVVELPSEYEALTRHVFQVFEYLPISGETHLSEYLPYSATENGWKKYNLYNFNFNDARKDKERNLNTMENIINGKLSAKSLNFDVSERLSTIITKIHTDSNSFEPAINTENNNSIGNLPSDAIVEVPSILRRIGVKGVSLGNLPEPIAALCNREISIAKLITCGSIKGDVDMIAQAMALDSTVNNLELAEKITHAYITEFKDYLPQFK
ncbi:MAG: hypothetical protein EAX86_12560 [Candidatus Heimdallarchaeota archaeon]|nr:hypothetical protein [Candidatus Heimdallarchaeota archaeon]